MPTPTLLDYLLGQVPQPTRACYQFFLGTDDRGDDVFGDPFSVPIGTDPGTIPGIRDGLCHRYWTE